jgi:hypothetical protein
MDKATLCFDSGDCRRPTCVEAPRHDVVGAARGDRVRIWPDGAGGEEGAT